MTKKTKKEHNKIVIPSDEKNLLDRKILKPVESIIEHKGYDGIINIGKLAGEELYKKFFVEEGIEFQADLKDKEKIEKWVKIMSEKVFMPYGLGCVFSEISDKKVIFNIFKCSIPDLSSNVPNAACLFHHTLYSTLWKKVFPKGEVIMMHSMGFGAPTCDFKCLTKPDKSEKDEIKKTIELLKQKITEKKKVAKFA